MSSQYDLRYTTRATEDIEGLRAFDQRRVVYGIENYLLHEPTRVSRSRIKQMEQPFWSQYRLRVDEFRVYYDVDEASRRVTILRIFEKGISQTPEQQS